MYLMRERYLSDIDLLPGFVERKGKMGKLIITREGNVWVVKYSNFKELLVFKASFGEAMDEILERIKNGNFKFRTPYEP